MSEQKSSSSTSSSPIIGLQLKGQQQVQGRTAGRELDALIAREVFGLVRCTGCDYYECYALPASPNHGGELREYSTRIEDAWGVVDELRKRALLVELTLGVGVYCRITGLRRQFAESREDTAPLAICLTALQAVE